MDSPIRVFAAMAGAVLLVKLIELVLILWEEYRP